MVVYGEVQGAVFRHIPLSFDGYAADAVLTQSGYIDCASVQICFCLAVWLN